MLRQAPSPKPYLRLCANTPSTLPQGEGGSSCINSIQNDSSCISWWHMLLAYAMNIQRSAKLFRNGRSQAVRIPREFEFPGKDVVIRKQGDKLIIEPVKKKKNSLAELLASWKPIDEAWPEIEDLPPDPVDL